MLTASSADSWVAKRSHRQEHGGNGERQCGEWIHGRGRGTPRASQRANTSISGGMTGCEVP